jgi:hypothetical protein
MDIRKQTINKVLDNLYIWIIGQKKINYTENN